MTKADPIDALRARVAVLDAPQRQALRRELEARGIAWERVAPPEATTARPSRLPLSPSQLHFWVQQHLYPRSSAYTIAFQWRFRGPLNRQALAGSLQHVVDRHEPLRTCFPAEDGQAWQSVQQQCLALLNFTDLSATPERFADSARAVATEPFDLARAPLLRAHLFQLGDNEHVLVLAIHHIVADGWSRGILMRELATCYRAYCAGETPVLPVLQRNFGDLVLAQGVWLEGQECQRQKAFWQARLAGMEPQELPTDRPRVGAVAPDCATLIHALPSSLSSAVGSLASRLGATPFAVLLAAFKLLIHRYSGQSDIAVCVPVAGRRDPDAAGLIGLFTNTLVLRTALDPSLTFRTWLNRVRETFADAFENQDFPFPKVVEALGVNRDAGQNPLFQIMFQVQTEGYRQQNAETVDVGIPGLEVIQEMLPLAEAKFDLTWHIMERENGHSLAIEYRTALFDAPRIERMVTHFRRLLESIVQAPDDILPRLDYMPAEERQALIDLGTPAPRPLPAVGVDEAISLMAARYPDGVALECDGKSWTYQELDAAADALARNLIAMPELAESGARVAVSMPGKAHSIIAFLAILKAGAIYVPLDPKHPADRLAYILEDAEASLVLTQETSLFAGQRCVDPTLLCGDAPALELPPADPSRIAYLLFTSGSTGRPKGVPIDHVGLLNQLRSLERSPGIAPGDRMLAITTPAFDISILEMLWPLSVGATVVLFDQELLFAPVRLAQTLDDYRITHLQATPASWRMLLDSGWPGRPGLVGLCGGEALDAQLAQRIIERIGSLWNVYGPTETTIWASALQVTASHVKSGKVPIGGLLDNTQFHVFDAYLQPVPEGVPGELFIGGIGLSPGYWRRPSLAAEKFVPNPCFDEKHPSSRLYRTGDLVIRRGNDEIEFVGRTDFQIKLRGYRIEIGEIESLLHEEPGVAQAIVVLDKPNERLVAYCLLEDRSGSVDKTAMRRELRLALAAKLPRYMVPAAIVLMEEFALNTNGKVDRKQLPAPEAPVGVKTPSAPRNDVEKTLLAIWREVLRREDIGVEDNFFDLGGDSVIAMQIVARAQAKGLVLVPTQLFEHQTVAAQALVAQASISEAVPPPVVTRPADATSAAKIDQLLSKLKQRNSV